MKREPVSSSHVASVGHEGDRLEVEFSNGAVYHYFGVPRSVYDELMKADSIGRHLRANVVGRFTHKKLASG